MIIIGIWLTCLLALATDGFTVNIFAEELAEMGTAEIVILVLAFALISWLFSLFMESYFKIKNHPF